MFAVLNDLQVMQKETKIKQDNSKDNILICYQRGNLKDLVQVKSIPDDLFSSIQEGKKIDVKVKLTIWGNNNNYGCSIKFLELLK